VNVEAYYKRKVRVQTISAVRVVDDAIASHRGRLPRGVATGAGAIMPGWH